MANDDQGTSPDEALPASGGLQQRKARLDALKARRQQIADPVPRDLGAIMAQHSQPSPDSQSPDAEDAATPDRPAPTTAVTPTVPPVDEAAGRDPFAQAGKGIPDLLMQFAGSASGAQPMQRQIVMHVYRILTQIPPTDPETVPGTPFTHYGVAQLVGMLGQRAEDPGAPGSRVAAMALQFLTAQEGKAAVSGISVEKLQTLAKRAEAMRGRPGGARTAGRRGFGRF